MGIAEARIIHLEDFDPAKWVLPIAKKAIKAGKAVYMLADGRVELMNSRWNNPTGVARKSAEIGEGVEVLVYQGEDDKRIMVFPAELAD